MERTGQLGNYAQPGVRDPVNQSYATLMDCGIRILDERTSAAGDILFSRGRCHPVSCSAQVKNSAYLQCHPFLLLWRNLSN